MTHTPWPTLNAGHLVALTNPSSPGPPRSGAPTPTSSPAGGPWPVARGADAERRLAVARRDAPHAAFCREGERLGPRVEAALIGVAFARDPRGARPIVAAEGKGKGKGPAPTKPQAESKKKIGQGQGL